MNNLTSLWAACVLSLGATVACSGNTLDGGSTSAPDGGAAVVEDDVASSTSRFTSAQVAAAQAACNEAHGPVDPATNRADIEVNLTGSWFLCSPPNVFKLTKSIEFDSDGTYHVLKPNAAGGLSREQGIDNEGTWKVQEGSASVEPGPFFPQFETSPRRLKMTVATSGFENWYVAM